MQRLPILYLYKKVVFPSCALTTGTREKRHRGLAAGDRVLALPIRGFFDILLARRGVATLSEVTSVEVAEDTVTVGIKGISRVRLRRIDRFLTAEHVPIPENGAWARDGIVNELRKKSQELIFLINVKESDKLIGLLGFINNPSQLSDFVANYFIVSFPRRYRIHREIDGARRLRNLMAVLDELIAKFREKREAGVS